MTLKDFKTTEHAEHTEKKSLASYLSRGTILLSTALATAGTIELVSLSRAPRAAFEVSPAEPRTNCSVFCCRLAPFKSECLAGGGIISPPPPPSAAGEGKTGEELSPSLAEGTETVCVDDSVSKCPGQLEVSAKYVMVGSFGRID